MNAVIQLFESSLTKVIGTFAHNWPYLLASILIGTLIKLFLDKDKVAAYLQNHQKGGVALATAVAVGTPLCSCGTTAVVIGMMASMMPWAPIVAFMVASPLSSPEGMIYTAGLFGWPFALAGFIGSILLGLAGGWLAGVLDRSGWLKDQFRFKQTVAASVPAAAPAASLRVNQPAPAMAATSCGCQAAPVLKLQPALVEVSANDFVVPQVSAQSSCGCGSPAAPAAIQPKASTSCCGGPVVIQPTASSCGCGSSNSALAAKTSSRPKVTWSAFAQGFLQDGPKLLVMFFGFAFIGYLINGLIPSSWVSTLFGAGHAYSVPLAATLGLPFYINSEGSLPLIRAMLDSGMSQGAALAFLIAGSGTSIGAIAGALSIAKWRVIAVVVTTLWAGSIVLGIAFDLLLATGVI
jgi:uncharacterized membrane protein YraQ (UPF0718 family)